MELGGVALTFEIALFSVHSHNAYHAMGPKESSPRSRLSEHVITPAVVLPGSRIDDLPPIVHLPADDPPRQCQHQVIPVVAVGGQPILSDSEGALQLLRHLLEGGGLKGVPVGHEHHL